MSLVHVKHLWVNAEGIQGADATNPEDNLLPDPHFEVAAIQLLGNQTVFPRILLNIGIEQVKLYPANLQFPNLGPDRSAENRDRDVKRLISGLRLDERQMREVLVKARRFLPTVLVD